MKEFQVGITDLSDAYCNDNWENWALNKRLPTILITKNFTGLLEKYPIILNNPNILIHATITGYGGTIFEEGVPKPDIILTTLKNLTEKQKERIVVRIDPIIPIGDCIKQSHNVYEKIIEMGFKRIRVSIMDLYPHVLERIRKISPTLEWTIKENYNWDLSHSGFEHKSHMIHLDFSKRRFILSYFPNTEICGEPGFECEGCISRKDLELLRIRPTKRLVKSDQREHCNCISNKKELLLMDTNCPHKCIYCYIKRLDDKNSI